MGSRLWHNSSFRRLELCRTGSCLLMLARSLHSDITEINKEMSELFGVPNPPEGTCIGPSADPTAEQQYYSNSRAGLVGRSEALLQHDPEPWHQFVGTAAAVLPCHPLPDGTQQLLGAQQQSPVLVNQLQSAASHMTAQLESMQLMLQQLECSSSLQHEQLPPAPLLPPQQQQQQQQQQQHQHQEATSTEDIMAFQQLPASLSARSPVAGNSPAAAMHADQQQQQQQQLTHVDNSGRASMVDVSRKLSSSRVATASCKVYLGPQAFNLVRHNAIAKGDVLTVAQVAGIQGAKQTSSLIPLCHNIFLSKADVQLELLEGQQAVGITAMAKTVGQTGVEMEALTAAAVAALTVYDMCKAVSKDIVITNLQLEHKEGGKSGMWQRSQE